MDGLASPIAPGGSMSFLSPIVPGTEIYSQISPGLTAANSPFPPNMPIPYTGMGDASSVFGRIPVTAAGLDLPQLGVPLGVTETETAGSFLGVPMGKEKKAMILAVIAAVIAAVIGAVIAAVIGLVGVVFLVPKPRKEKEKEAELYPYPEYPEEYPQEGYPDKPGLPLDGKPNVVPTLNDIKSAAIRKRRSIPAQSKVSTAVPTMTVGQVNALTSVILSALQTQECLQRLVCESSEIAKSLPGYDAVFPLLSVFLPVQYRHILEKKPDCDVFTCGALKTRK